MKSIFSFIKKNRNIILLTISFVFLTMLILGMTYAYFDLKTGGETESTMNIGGAEISATYAYSNSINITDVLPGNGIIASKDITLTYKNTSSDEYKVYLKAVIDYNSFTNEENGGVLKYEIKSGNDTIKIQTTFPTIAYGKETLTEIPIPANSNGTLKYTINFYFPESNQLQNPDGQLALNASISVESDDSSEYSKTLLKQVDLMYQNEAETNGLEKDDTTDENIRYVGTSPKNYISFNNEIWRIIGLFNVYNNDTSKTEKLVKIIRNDSLGNYSWDSSESSINSGWGINEWSQADLMIELNTDYLDTNKTSGTTTWYNGANNTKTGSYDYSKNIKFAYIDKIANVRWNLGGIPAMHNSVKTFYTLERGTNHISNPSDGIERTSTWVGKVALIYPSDYGYASIDTTCRSDLASGNCENNNWLYSGSSVWTLAPHSSDADGLVFGVDTAGSVGGHRSNNSAYGVRPTLFLKSDIILTGGTGEIENPYTIE